MATVSTPPRAANDPREMLTLAAAPCPPMSAPAGPQFPVDPVLKIQGPGSSQPALTPFQAAQPMPRVLATQCTQAPTFSGAPPHIATAQLPGPGPLPSPQLCPTPVLPYRPIPATSAALWASGALPAQIPRQVPAPSSTDPPVSKATPSLSALASPQESYAVQACGSFKIVPRSGRSSVAAPMSPVPEDGEAEGPRLLDAPKPDEQPPAVLRPAPAVALGTDAFASQVQADSVRSAGAPLMSAFSAALPAATPQARPAAICPATPWTLSQAELQMSPKEPLPSPCMAPCSTSPVFPQPQAEMLLSPRTPWQLPLSAPISTPSRCLEVESVPNATTTPSTPNPFLQVMFPTGAGGQNIPAASLDLASSLPAVSPCASSAGEPLPRQASRSSQPRQLVSRMSSSPLVPPALSQPAPPVSSAMDFQLPPLPDFPWLDPNATLQLDVDDEPPERPEKATRGMADEETIERCRALYASKLDEQLLQGTRWLEQQTADRKAQLRRDAAIRRQQYEQEVDSTLLEEVRVVVERCHDRLTELQGEAVRQRQRLESEATSLLNESRRYYHFKAEAQRLLSTSGHSRPLEEVPAAMSPWRPWPEDAPGGGPRQPKLQAKPFAPLPQPEPVNFLEALKSMGPVFTGSPSSSGRPYPPPSPALPFLDRTLSNARPDIRTAQEMVNQAIQTAASSPGGRSPTVPLEDISHLWAPPQTPPAPSAPHVVGQSVLRPMPTRSPLAQSFPGETTSALAATQWPLPTRETTTVTQWGPAPPRAISGQFPVLPTALASHPPTTLASHPQPGPVGYAPVRPGGPENGSPKSDVVTSI
ncbi:unnamed protein product [Symbiodinium sp. CCMP2456]|nr:unnamed protein product [Symbiodinium sp. CCMP2456]